MPKSKRKGMASIPGTNHTVEVESSDPPATLARLTLTVCMTGRDTIKDESMIKKRLEMFNKGKTTTHWPFESRLNSFGIPTRKGFKV